jgi:hypothetical protein
MKLIVKTGDVLNEVVDVLICTANPTLGAVKGDFPGIEELRVIRRRSDDVSEVEKILKG